MVLQCLHVYDRGASLNLILLGCELEKERQSCSLKVSPLQFPLSPLPLPLQPVEGAAVLPCLARVCHCNFYLLNELKIGYNM